MSERGSRYPGGWYARGPSSGNGFNNNRYGNDSSSWSSSSIRGSGDRHASADHRYQPRDDRHVNQSRDLHSESSRFHRSRNVTNDEGKPSGSSPLARYVGHMSSHGSTGESRGGKRDAERDISNAVNTRGHNSSSTSSIPKKVRREHNVGSDNRSHDRSKQGGRSAMDAVTIDDDDDNDVTMGVPEDDATLVSEAGNPPSKESTASTAKVDEDEKKDPPEVVEWKERVLSQLLEKPDGGISSLHIHLPQECLQPDSEEHTQRKEEAVVVAIRECMAFVGKEQKARYFKDEDPDNDLIYSSGEDYYSDDNGCSNGMAYYGPSSQRKRFIYGKAEVTKFLSCLPTNLVFNMGFNVLGLSSKDEDHCFCPCSGRMRKWRQDKRNDIDEILEGSDRCGATGTFTPAGLIAHLKQIPGPMHHGIFQYLKYLYENHNGAGLAHKAFYDTNTKKQRDALAAEQRRIYRSKQKLADDLAAERKEKEESSKQMKELERKMANLERVNKDAHDRLAEERKIIESLRLKEEKSKELTEKQQLRKCKLYDSFWKSLGLGHGTRYSPALGQEVEDHVANNAKPEKSKISIEVPQCFNINDIFRDWSSREEDTTMLFRDLADEDEECEEGHYPEQVHAGDLLVKMNVKFGKDLDWSDDEDEEKEMDTVRDEGGPLREFLSQIWLQLGSLGVPVAVESYETACQLTNADGDLQVGQNVWVMEPKNNSKRKPTPRRTKVVCVHPQDNGTCLYDVENSNEPPTAITGNKSKKKKQPTDESIRARKDCANPTTEKTLAPAELFVELFESTDGGFVPLTNERLKDNIEAAIKHAQEGKRSRDRKTMVRKLMDKATLYYRAIGRIMIHSLVTFHPISHSALPNVYRNVVMRGVYPEDEEYPDIKLVKDLREIGFEWLESEAKMSAIVGKMTLDDMFGDGDKQVITEENLMDVLSKQAVSCRSHAIDALIQGFTLKTTVPVHDVLGDIPLEILSKKAFTLPLITAENVIAVLIPKYMGENGEEGKPKPVAKTVFEEVLPQLLREEWEAEKKVKDASGISRHQGMGFIRQFVAFSTGMAFLPFAEVNSKFHIAVEFAYIRDSGDEVTDDSLPHSHTCNNTLVLPATAYGGNKETLKQRLETSFQFSAGSFGMR